jgi:tight adherence protein B
MNQGIFLPALMLAAVLCASAVVLRVDSKRRRIDGQLAVATATQAPATTGPASARIRVRQANTEWQGGLLYTLLRYDVKAQQNWHVFRVVLAGFIAASAAMVIARMALPIWLVPVPGIVTAMVVVRVLFAWQQDRFTDKLKRQLPDTIEMIVSAVRAGLPVGEAFRAVAREMPEPTKTEFDQLLGEMALGLPPEDCLLNLFRRTRVSEYAMFSVTLAVQAKAGGRLAETLQTLGETVRQRIALAGRAKALSAESKLSARVLASIPILTGAVMSFIRPGFLDPLLRDPRGQKLFFIGIVLLVMGILTMRRMIKKGTTV